MWVAWQVPEVEANFYESHLCPWSLSLEAGGRFTDVMEACPKADQRASL